MSDIQRLIALLEGDAVVPIPAVSSPVIRTQQRQYGEYGGPIEAYGVMGVKSKPWRRKFRSQAEYAAWLDKHEGNVEVYGSRRADEALSKDLELEVDVIPRDARGAEVESSAKNVTGVLDVVLGRTQPAGDQAQLSSPQQAKTEAVKQPEISSRPAQVKMEAINQPEILGKVEGTLRSMNLVEAGPQGVVAGAQGVVAGAPMPAHQESDGSATYGAFRRLVGD